MSSNMSKICSLYKHVTNRYSIRLYSQKYHYEIPEVYSNSFYLANASLLDNTNWYLHNALSKLYTPLIEKLKIKKFNNLDAMKTIDQIMQVIEPCNTFIEVQFPIKKYNGDTIMVKGCRAEHGKFIKNIPCFGGLRLCSKSEIADIKAVAALSTYKYACMGINMLGAHGGIEISPNKFKPQELKTIIEQYTIEVIKKGFCGENSVFEPDINCGSNEMSWMVAANSRFQGTLGDTCAMGKPHSFGGINNWEKAVGQGIFWCVDLCLKNQNIMNKINLSQGWTDKTYILQGLGSVGYNTALYLEEAQAKCIGIIEHDCHVYDPTGINIKEAYDYKKKNGSLYNYKLVIKYIDANEVLVLKCDIIVLAATQKSIPYHIAQKIQAKIILEAANGPLSPCVHKVLTSRDKLVLPDIFTNSGSSIASYLEYLKNMSHVSKENLWLQKQMENDNLGFFNNLHHSTNFSSEHYQMINELPEQNVTETILHNIERTFQDILLITKTYNLGLDFRTAAYIKALERLFWEAYYYNIPKQI